MRIIGTETEYGVYLPGDPWAHPIALSAQAVRHYAEISRRGTAAEGAPPVRWDYTGEDPLNDLRGMRMSRAAADPLARISVRNSTASMLIGRFSPFP